MTSSTARPTAFSAPFVDEVRREISDADNELIATLRFPGQPAVSEAHRLGLFVHQLYAKAPPEIVDGETPASVALVVRECVATIRLLDETPDRIALRRSAIDGSERIFIALDDRPFIISSVAERISDLGLKVRAYLHPIVVREGNPVALSFIELSPQPDKVEVLLERLRHTLALLRQVVNDFDTMRATIGEWARKPFPSMLASSFEAVDSGELQAFLSWMLDDCFFLLGTRVIAAAGAADSRTHQGIWREQTPYSATVEREILEDVQLLAQGNLDLSIRKLRSSSIVHRSTTLLSIVVRSPESPEHVLSIIGYLTSKAWNHEALDIPILRRRVGDIVSSEGVLPNSHDYKYMVEVIDNMPTDEALCMPTEQLSQVVRLALGVFNREVTRSATFLDNLIRRSFTMVVLPPELYSAAVKATIQHTIESSFGASLDSSEVFLDSSKRRQLRLYLSTPMPLQGASSGIPDSLARDIGQATLTWVERLRDVLTSGGDNAPENIADIFPADYQASHTIDEAVVDLRETLALSERERVGVVMHAGARDTSLRTLSFASLGKEISISEATPVLENVGLEVLTANSYACTVPHGTAHLLKLSTKPYDGELLDVARFNTAVAPGLASIVQKSASNDPLNLLLRKIPVTLREIALLRAYCALLWQVNRLSTKRSMWDAVAAAPEAARHLCALFAIRFDPASSLSVEERIERSAEKIALFNDEARKITDITQDRILKAILSLIRSTVRTNFFTETDTFAFKIRSGDVELMPYPRPLFEIFVFSPRIEGTHLRSAYVARGGIRWSERLDDYRSEVLGLMKTQKVKNVIIVPSGAKGGFIVKQLPKGRDEMAQAVEQGYREYIRALLTLADNKIDGDVAHPNGVVVLDGPDPYFVVAADKGTATFSDIANGIAQREFGFWLDDAFASGGSVGYDHKKYGITARGGWECVKRHLRDRGIPYEDATFSVVGIGDMSGDVFGNGLLMSEKMALIAAFNHKHIFIDPTPDPARTFHERKRLFELPRSQWSDVDPAAISAGGGVFNRFDKEIRLSPEIRRALGIADDVPEAVDGETLITLVLKAPVDLIWNGGIGTYVKASAESNSEVNDSTNDRVRINASEVRARVVGEGGNLGFTQRARIEFALRGGSINTDAIDNSGGVDLSDHEVNLKLLLTPLVKQGRIALEARNELLKDIAPDVVESVLVHNREQALLLSVSQRLSVTEIEQYRSLIREMHRLGYLDRNRDYLPDDGELDERAAKREGLTRPELAVCSAAIKMWAKEDLKGSDLVRDPQLERFLIQYFPERIRREWRTELLAHSLRADIIASEVVGSLLPAVGISFVHTVAQHHNLSASGVFTALLAADAILGVTPLAQGLKRLDTAEAGGAFAAVWLELGSALQKATSWLLATHGTSLSLGELLGRYQGACGSLCSDGAKVFVGEELARFEKRCEEYRSMGATPHEAVRLALFRRVLQLLEMIWTSKEFDASPSAVAPALSTVLEELGINSLFKIEATLLPQNKWEEELVAGSYQEIRRQVSRITGRIVRASHTSPAAVRDSIRSVEAFRGLRGIISELEELARQGKPFQVAALPVIARKLREMGMQVG